MAISNTYPPQVFRMLGAVWSSHVTAITGWWGVASSPALPVESGRPTRPYVKASRSKKCTDHSLHHACNVVMLTYMGVEYRPSPFTVHMGRVACMTLDPVCIYKSLFTSVTKSKAVHINFNGQRYMHIS